jgi:hypothetical protein
MARFLERTKADERIIQWNLWEGDPELVLQASGSLDGAVDQCIDTAMKRVGCITYTVDLAW